MTTDNKVYSIGVKGTSSSFALIQLQHDVFHGLQCLKGLAEGKRIYIPFEQIDAITEFDSWADYHASSKKVAGNGSSPTAKSATRKIKKQPKAKKRK